MLFDFIRTYWRQILEVCLFICSVVVFCLKKKSISNINELIALYAVQAVKDVEQSDVSGSDNKLTVAVGLVKLALSKKFPQLNVDSYDGIIKFTIEKILSTPQKKEVK